MATSTASGLVIPSHVAQNMERDTAVDRQLAIWKVYERLARDVDSRLSLVWVRDDVPAGAIYGDMVPGRWHFRRDNTDQGAPDTYIPITREDGGFREPVAADIDRLRDMDLWRPEVKRRVKEGQERQRVAKEKETAERREARRADAHQNLKSLISPGVSFSDVRWTNQAKAKRGRRG